MQTKASRRRTSAGGARSSQNGLWSNRMVDHSITAAMAAADESRSEVVDAPAEPAERQLQDLMSNLSFGEDESQSQGSHDSSETRRKRKRRLGRDFGDARAVRRQVAKFHRRSPGVVLRRLYAAARV